MIETTANNFGEDVLASSSTEPVIVDFWAPWCGPCRQLSPILEKIGEENNLKVVSVNIDEQPELARNYQIMSIPTIMVFKDGKDVGTIVGLQAKSLLTDKLVSLAW